MRKLPINYIFAGAVLDKLEPLPLLVVSMALMPRAPCLCLQAL